MKREYAGYCYKVEDIVFIKDGKCSKERDRTCPYRDSAICLLKLLGLE